MPGPPEVARELLERGQRAGDDGADGELADGLHAVHPKSTSCRMCERDGLVRLHRALERRRRPREHTRAGASSGRLAAAHPDRDVQAIPRYGRNVTTHAVLAGRIPVTRVTPALPDGRWRPKAFEGEVVPFRATAFREGHDQVGAMLRPHEPVGRRCVTSGCRRWRPAPTGGRPQALLDEQGVWHWHVTRIRRRVRHVAARRRAQDRRGRRRRAHARDRRAPVRSRGRREVAPGRRRGAASARSPPGCATPRHPTPTGARSSTRRRSTCFAARPLASLDDRLARARDPRRARARRRRRLVRVLPALRGRATPEGRHAGRAAPSARRRSASPAVAAMGFDVVYLPPIHPIGATNRKGRNNTLDPRPAAIPARRGRSAAPRAATTPSIPTSAPSPTSARSCAPRRAVGHRGRARPRAAGRARPPVGGRASRVVHARCPTARSRYAENPPKKYQDIYPINFDNDPEGIRAEVLRIVRHWIAQGVQHLPRRQPAHQAAAVLGVADRDGERRASRRRLPRRGVHPPRDAAGARHGRASSRATRTSPGATRSRSSRSSSPRSRSDTADFLRPNLFVNTPDILTEYLQFGGRPAYTDPRGDRRDRGADLGRLRRATSCSRTSRAPAPKRTSTTRSTSTSCATGRAPRSAGRLARAVPRHASTRSAARTRHSASCATSASTGATTTRCSCTRSTSTARFTPDRPRRHGHRRRERRPALGAGDDGAPRLAAHRASTPGDPLRGRGPRHRRIAGTGATHNFVRLDAFTETRRTSSTSYEAPMTDRMPPAGPAVDDAVLAAVAEGRHSRPALGARACIRIRPPPARPGRAPSSARAGRSPTASTAVFADGDARAARARAGTGSGQGSAPGGPGGYEHHDAPTTTDPTGRADDPYRFAPTIGELDLHLIGEGRHEQLWQVLGAHVRARTRASHGHGVHRLGPARPRRARGRRLQPLGRRRRTRCADGRQRRLGAVRPRPRARHDLQVRAAHRARRRGC